MRKSVVGVGLGVLLMLAPVVTNAYGAGAAQVTRKGGLVASHTIRPRYAPVCLTAGPYTVCGIYSSVVHSLVSDYHNWSYNLVYATNPYNQYAQSSSYTSGVNGLKTMYSSMSRTDKIWTKTFDYLGSNFRVAEIEPSGTASNEVLAWSETQNYINTGTLPVAFPGTTLTQLWEDPTMWME